jgi:hypothetical protein
MDKFRVGQRVRLIEEGYACGGEVVPTGALGVVIVGKDRQGDYEVLFDEYPCPTIHDPAWFVGESHLEPVYDGDEKSAWEECAWQPNTKVLDLGEAGLAKITYK